jgi:hypothetical protein
MVAAEMESLVQTLSQFRRDVTVDACQCDSDDAALVYFHFEGEQTDEPRFFFELSRRLNQHAQNCHRCQLQLEFRSGCQRPVARLKSAAGDIAILEESFRSALSALAVSKQPIDGPAAGPLAPQVAC